MKNIPSTLLRYAAFAVLTLATHFHLNAAEEDPLVVAKYLFPLGGNALLSTDDHLLSTASNFSYAFSAVSLGLNNGWVNTDASITPSTETDAAASNAYFFFTVTPNEGTPVSLNRLTFGSAFYANAANAYSVSLFVRSSVDNYATNIGGVLAETGQSSTLTPSFTPRTLDLTGPAYQNLSTPITFRFYMVDSLTGATRYYGFNNVTLEAIPEPSTWVLLLIAGGTLCYFRGAIMRRPSL